MATATLNPVFLSISGRIGNAVFYCRRNTQCVRSYVVPENPDTALQRKVRGNFASAVKSWQMTTPEERYTYTRKARHLGLSGYNLFISVFMTGRMIRQKKYNTVCGRTSILKNNTQYNRIHSVSLSLPLLDKTKTQVMTNFLSIKTE